MPADQPTVWIDAPPDVLERAGACDETTAAGGTPSPVDVLAKALTIAATGRAVCVSLPEGRFVVAPEGHEAPTVAKMPAIERHAAPATATATAIHLTGVDRRALAHVAALPGSRTAAGASASVSDVARALGHRNPETARGSLRKLAKAGRLTLVSAATPPAAARYRVSVDELRTNAAEATGGPSR